MNEAKTIPITADGNNIPVISWYRKYDKSWKGILVPDAFKHPAKISFALADAIYQYAFEQGWLKEGDTVADPFGGVACFAFHAMQRGLHWYGCELEQKFVDLGYGFDCNGTVEAHIEHFADEAEDGTAIFSERELVDRLARCGLSNVHDPHHVEGNIESWNRRYGTHLPHWGSARLVQGDSRKLRAVLGLGQRDATVTSPPFLAAQDGGGINKKGYGDGSDKVNERTYNATMVGNAEGQLGQMNEGDLDGLITSPPYSSTPISAGNVGNAMMKEAWGKGGNLNVHEVGYAQRNPDNLGSMPEGDIDGIVTSPPFNANKSNAVHGETKGFHSHDKNESKNRMKRDYELADSEGNLGNLSMDEGLDMAVTSPPYAAISAGAGGLNHLPAKDESQQGGRAADSASQDTDQRYGTSEGQLARYKDEGLDAALSSPPYSAARIGNESGAEQVGHDANYGSEDGQLGGLKDEGFEASVTSPPYEGSMTAGGHLVWENQGQVGAHKESKGKEEIYGTHPSQLGNESGETFWSAAKQIVNETYRALKPGAHAFWVVKAFVRNKQIVDFPDQWRRLCEAVGFETVTIIRAWQVEDNGTQLAIGGEVKGKAKRLVKSKKSFFRRLHESKFPDTKIDYEIVLVQRKPL